MAQKKTIRVCGECKIPLIWTFAFDGNERFCINCQVPTPMFDGNPDEEVTRELIFKKRLVDAIWKVIYGNKGMIPRGRFGRGGCKKDDREGRFASSCDNHNAHLSKSEVEWDKIARACLANLKGKF